MILSDHIASLIEKMLEEGGGSAEVRRNDLAQKIGCVPSQISYVLTSRFTPERGYVIDSRRGGGGYIRIVRVVHSGPQKLLYLIQERIGDTVTQAECNRMIAALQQEKLVTKEEAGIMCAAVNDTALSVPMPDTMKNALRAKVLKSMLTALARQDRSACPAAGKEAEKG